MTAGRTQKHVDVDPEAGAYRATYHYPSEPPSLAVPLAMMALTDSDTTDLEPLYEAESVDPEALDELFRPSGSTVARECKVTFSYHGYDVTVKSFGRILIRPPTTEVDLTVEPTG
ncbi:MULTISPECIES: HalOD1 output domain-containing protein [Halorussus]|uniref:HalOD1 output domain-containing protein n=1 Tax=Halorussus TaxID=1070314 RepID=UPI0020A08977|nr:HalOD1 output domain-containing protein [Halorussus vallis]USZ74945.1 hypothetical protein NGM07_16080 [Halorussus vallis]